MADKHSLSKYTHMVASLPFDLLLLVLSFCSGDDVNIMPPLSVVNHAIYQSSHTNRKRISALKHPPFNIARPSLAKYLELYSNSMVPFVHACESGVFLPTLRNLYIDGSMGDAEMTEFFRAIATGSMGALAVLSLFDHNISDPCMIAFSNAIRNGSMGALRDLRLGNEIGDVGMQAFANAIGSGSWGPSLISGSVGVGCKPRFSTDVRHERSSSSRGSMGALRASSGSHSNQIGDAGMVEFSRAIAIGSLRALTHLDLDDNQIGDAGMISLSEAIGNGSLPALEDVDLDDNPGDSAPVDEALTNRDM